MTLLSVLVILAQAAPVDPTIDWLLSEKASTPVTQPATVPSTQPVSPLVNPAQAGTVWATITLSDGTTLAGNCWTTVGKPLRVWDEEKKQYVDLALEQIASMEAEVLWERDEPEWRFKTSGSDEKVHTGRSYPARETQYRITLTNGDKITGGVVAPIYLKQGDEPAKAFVLHKRAKGEVGQRLDQLVYVRSIRIGDAKD